MYIGLTSKKLERRLKQHVITSVRDKNRINDGYTISIIELESDLTKQDAIDLEISYISRFGLDNLTNTTIGGEGVFGKKYTIEEKLNWYNSIEVEEYNIEGEIINEYFNITECSVINNISHSSIFYCINNKNITSFNRIFVKKGIKSKELKLYDLYGNLISTHKSASDIYKKYNLNQSLGEFSKRLNNGIKPKQLKQKYFILYPNFNLSVMLESLKRYKIYNGSDLKYFMTINDISKYLLVDYSFVSDVLSKIKKSAKNYQILYYDEEIKEYINELCKKIVELDDNGNIKECSNYYNLDSSDISKICRGKRKHVKKHKFKYIDDIV